ncbi:kynurenine formamidase-like [Dreissena polymorpha]|nr:kynurenine formamidase-like [Dreissena polymorpha]
MALEMDLDHHYSPSRWSHRMGPTEVIQAHIQALKEGSEASKREVQDHEIGISYGISDKEKLDIFGAKTLPGEAPIFVYIHGGYWTDLSRDISSFMASTFCKAGAMVVAIGYNLAPQVGMTEIISQVKKAISYVLNLAKRRGSSGVYLCGHSAGGHLAAMMLTINWMEETMVSPGLIKGAVLVSGIYDLMPLLSTYVNGPLKMTKEETLLSSPNSHLRALAELSSSRRIIVAFAAHDPPEFQRQSVEFNTSLIQNNLHSTMLLVPDCDHFNVIENLEQEGYILTKETLKLMGLNIDIIMDKMRQADIS